MLLNLAGLILTASAMVTASHLFYLTRALSLWQLICAHQFCLTISFFPSCLFSQATNGWYSIGSTDWGLFEVRARSPPEASSKLTCFRISPSLINSFRPKRAALRSTLTIYQTCRTMFWTRCDSLRLTIFSAREKMMSTLAAQLR